MAPKKAKKRGKKGKQAEVEPDDVYMSYDSSQLLTTQQDLMEKLSVAKVKRNMLQMEKDMIHDFYHNTRAEITELEARIKNFDTDMQSMEEAHNTQIKVFKQKVKHLEYEHGNDQDNVQTQAKKLMNEEKQHHNEKEKEMLKDKKKNKDDYARDEISYQG